MIILAIDYGEARTGIAVCDKLEMMATPVDTIFQYNKEALIAEILLRLRDTGAEMMLVGLPKNMDGSEGFRAQATLEFAEQLRASANVPVETWDERLTTMAAGRLLNEAGKKGKKRKNIIDAQAAVMILQSYIDYRKNK